jgi:hypothetical protein
MAGRAQNLDHEEFWRPVLDHPSQPRVAPAAADLCESCGAERIAGARFCHLCGAGRSQRHGLSHWLSPRRFGHSLGLSLGPLIAFLVGVACLLAAVGVGIIYSATTVLDWQAIQAWRIQWLLAATAAFVGGLLLRQPKG